MSRKVLKDMVKIAEMAFLATVVLESSDEDEIVHKPKRRKRRVWQKEWLREREKLGFCAELLPEMRHSIPESYRNIIRMSDEQFNFLLGLVKPHIEKLNTNMRLSITAEARLVLTLHYLATGDNFKSLQLLYRISQPAISRIIPEVLDAIYKVLVADFIKIPKSETEWETVANRFNEMCQFPNCIGAVDGKHIVMVSPPNNGSMYYNYKGTHSIVMIGVADADYKLLYVDVGREGRFANDGVFNCCSFGQALNKNQLHLPEPKPLPGRDSPVPYILVADDTIAMHTNLMKPFVQDELTLPQRVFNYRQNRARQIIENVFGIMSARFRVLRKPIHLRPEKTKKVVLACSVLHNFLITSNKEFYAPASSFDHYNQMGNVTSLGDWRTEIATGSMHSLEPLQSRTDCKNEIQREFMNYFTVEGDLPWQYEHV